MSKRSSGKGTLFKRKDGRWQGALQINGKRQYVYANTKREAQEKLHAQAGVVKTKNYKLIAVEDARKAMAQNPNLPKNIFNLAQVLSDLETDETDKEAIDLLGNVYKAKNDFSYKQRAGQIRIKQIKRNIREIKETLEADPDNEADKTKLAKLKDLFNKNELEHYRLCVENYPTDLQGKYEYGIRACTGQVVGIRIGSN